jgi:hypothetical protein
MFLQNLSFHRKGAKDAKSFCPITNKLPLRPLRLCAWNKTFYEWISVGFVIIGVQ